MRPFYVYLLLVLKFSVVITSDCGKRKINVKGFITGGHETAAGEWPWHVAILHLERNQTSSYKCGGSVIGEYFILTAAHCSRNIHNIELSPEAISVHLGKVMLYKPSAHMQNHGVLRVAAHENFNASTFKNDIALLILETKITYTDYIQPICLWDRDDFSIKSVVGQIATAVGWGWTEHDDQETDELRAANLPIVGDFTCLEKNVNLFGRSIFEGAFCAGYSNGTSVCNGDSGGGLFLNILNTWYIRGIVSFGKQDFLRQKCDTKELVGIVNVAYYIDWITSKMKTNTAQNSNDEDLSQLTIYRLAFGKPQDAVNTFLQIKSRPFERVISEVYEMDSKKVPKIFSFIEAFQSLEQKLNAAIALFTAISKNNNLRTKEATQLLKTLDDYSNRAQFSTMPSQLQRTVVIVVNALQTPPRISAKKCTEYSEFRSDSDTPPVAEFPHMVSVTKKPSLGDSGNQFYCSGVLISPNFALSAAYCFYDVDLRQFVITVGDLNIVKRKRGAQPQEIEIEKVIKHYDFVPASYYSNIVLIKLKNSLKLSQDTRPACLWPFPAIPETEFTFTAFPYSGYITGNMSGYDETCFKTSMEIIGDDECNNHFGKPYGLKEGVKNSQVCAKNVKCQGSYGGPLQMKNSTQNGPIYSVVGLLSFQKYYHENIALDKAVLFERISFYIDWIESIVWN